MLNSLERINLGGMVFDIPVERKSRFGQIIELNKSDEDAIVKVAIRSLNVTRYSLNVLPTYFRNVLDAHVISPEGLRVAAQKDLTIKKDDMRAIMKESKEETGWTDYFRYAGIWKMLWPDQVSELQMDATIMDVLDRNAEFGILLYGVLPMERRDRATLDALLGYRVAHQEKMDSLGLSEDVFDASANYYQNIKREAINGNSWKEIIDLGYAMRILYPERSNLFELNNLEWRQVLELFKKNSDMMVTDDFAKTVANLKVLSAEDVKVGNRGVEINSGVKPPNFSERPMPVRRAY